MLRIGQPFPSITGETTKGNILSIPSDLGGRWAALIFYRGHF